MVARALVGRTSVQWSGIEWGKASEELISAWYTVVAARAVRGMAITRRITGRLEMKIMAPQKPA